MEAGDQAQASLPLEGRSGSVLCDCSATGQDSCCIFPDLRLVPVAVSSWPLLIRSRNSNSPAGPVTAGAGGFGGESKLLTDILSEYKNKNV